MDVVSRLLIGYVSCLWPALKIQLIFGIGLHGWLNFGRRDIHCFMQIHTYKLAVDFSFQLFYM